MSNNALCINKSVLELAVVWSSESQLLPEFDKSTSQSSLKPFVQHTSTHNKSTVMHEIEELHPQTLGAMQGTSIQHATKR